MENVDILNVLPCGYVSFNDSGIITNCNNIVEDWIGLPREHLAGKSIENIFTLATRIFYNTHFFPLVKLHSHASEVFLSLKNKNDHDIPVLANAHRILHGDTSIIHCIFIRVEQRKKFEQELLDARRRAENALNENRQLNELTQSLEKQALALDKQYRMQVSVNENLVKFSKIISHDLQEPIRKVRIFADLLSQDANAANDKRKLLAQKIEISAAKLKRLTESLHQYIMIDSENTFTSVDLNSIIDLARMKAVELHQFSDFEIEVKKMPVVDGYASQLELMFYHLIANAIQFKHQQRKLHIKIKSIILQENLFMAFSNKYKYADCVKISFEDNGIGFPEKYKDYVFGLLSKLDNATSGLGVGLSLVKKVVDNHFGHISVSSKPGAGTLFEIELPQEMEKQ